MKILELFAGTKSFSGVMRERGHDCFTVDINGECDYTVDILHIDLSKLPFKPDVIWASPPCTWFTVMQIGRNWNHDHTPKTDGARLGMQLVKKTVEIIDELKPLFWFIENPVGKLRKLNLIGGERKTITYCQYGEPRMKPTDIWTNCTMWTPRPACKCGSPCHPSTPRGAKTVGTQSMDKVTAGRIPQQLTIELEQTLTLTKGEL